MKVIQYIKINHLFNRVAFVSGVILTLLATVLCLPINSGEQEAQAATGTAQESSITMNFASNTASVDLAVSSSEGTFATSSESDKASFSIITNNYTGYTLTISAPDDNGTLVNGNDSLTSIGSNLTASEFNTTSNNGKWGWMPNVYQSNDKIIDNTGSSAVYLPSPTTTAITLDVTNSANTTAKDYSISLGARADYTKPNGTYSKTFVLTAVANKINYSVTYDKNTTDTVTNMPYSDKGNIQSGDTSSTSITLSDLVPERESYSFLGWCSVATSDDTCSGTTYNPDGAGTSLTYGIDQTTVNIANLYAMWGSAGTQCDDTKLCVQYEGNGLTYDGSKTVNRVNYNSSISQQEMTKYSHTSNISDAGVKSGSYSNNLATKDVISIPGASELDVTITYGTENNWDMLYVFQGEYTETISRNMNQASTGWLYKYMGGNNTTTTVTITIPGDTATFGFYSDGSGNYYGYYAIISGGSVINRTVASGEYATPTGTNAIFHGWSSTQTTAGGGLPSQVEYTDESEVKSKMPGDEGEAKTLYAVWQQGQNITFNMDSNVSSIAILNSDGTTAGTITASGQSLVLAQGNTYSIKPTHTTGYNTDTITKTTGAGTLSDNQFTVEAGAATLNVTSRALATFDQAFAAAGKTKYNGYYKIQDANIDICSSVDSADLGVVGEVIDVRDNSIYKIGKLADNKCWLLDNLRLDLVAHKNDLNSTNTNATNEQLAYLKGTSTGTSSDKWAMSGVSYWTSSYSYSAPWIDRWNQDTTTTSYGEGSGKIGVYYNYCAASAGTYCWGNGTSYTGSPSSDPKTNTGYDIDGDICPAGWRMPTGGAIATGTIAKGEYRNLYNQYSSATEGQAAAFRNALSTPLSGTFNNGSASLQWDEGYFWSSTWADSGIMYVLNVRSNSVYPQYYGNRNGGNSVRCTLQ